MGKKKRGGHRPKEVEKPLDSDDEFTSKDDADPNDRDFYLDEVDQFHEDQDKILLEDRSYLEPADSSSEEEVFGLGLDDDDDEDNDAQIESYKKQLRHLRAVQAHSQRDDTEEIPDEKAWGVKKHRFYGGEDSDDEDGSEAEDGGLDMKACLELQKKVAAEMDEEDFGLDMFKPKEASGQLEAEEVVESEVSKRQDPEFLPLYSLFMAKKKDMDERFLPLWSAVRKRTDLAPSSGLEYLETRLQILSSFILNCTFYLKLKHDKQPTARHPVLKAIAQDHKLLEMLDDTADRSGLNAVVDGLLAKLKAGKDLKLPLAKRGEAPWYPEYRKTDGKGKGSRKRKRGREESDEVLGDDKNEEESAEQGEQEETDEFGKRAINYKISKNKGLTPRRKKEYRNPRVRNREKYRKAKIRRKGQVREPRKEINPYAGEKSGIRIGVIHSRKL